ncbi:hypothetical protein H8A99_13290 [Bradyrhizobium sp. Arg68]|uniref:hypothetical protein n=1 Tax=Bradyrhizobium ivorense TaxID=2511166 RepID=UPI001E341AF2|nr:hypothetical protein [Bradyrhizobium ivorense]MCC8937420.1 hypothetical protein [Bradyrhizobium ivorense]
MTSQPMPSAREIYAQRRAAKEAQAISSSLDVVLGVAKPTPSGQGADLDHHAIYARRRQEARQRGRAAG